MGTQSRTNPGFRAFSLACLAGLAALLLCVAASPQANIPLILPSAVAYDTGGNLYFAEMGNHQVRRLTPAGILSVVAGIGTQGFAGDGGPATAAQLDSPAALAIDSAGDLLIADTHNHRVRRVDAVTGVITTVLGTGTAGAGPDGQAATATAIDMPSALALDASGNLFVADLRRQVVRRVDHSTGLVSTVAGNGVEGSQGDGGPARSASLDSPAGLAVDAAGNLFISDAHNQRVRRVDAATGAISTLAGTGAPGFSDGAAASAALRLPRGLALDAAGTLYIVDAGNHRLRQLDPLTGQITTIAGEAVEGFAGDGGPAVLASLNSPRAVTLSGAGLPTLADTANGRVRQVDANGVIQTIAGAGAVSAAGLVLSGPATAVYGGGAVTATLAGGTASGSVVFLEGASVLGQAGLAGNVASFSTGMLPAGVHSLIAQFAGDATHPALQSNSLSVLLTPATVVASPTAVTQVYGLPIPALSGSLTGVLTRDAGSVQATFSSAAVPLSGAGTYPISATLSGSAAANYGLTTNPAAVVITRAASTVSLSASTLLAHVSSSTSGQPGGSVTLLDGGAPSATVTAIGGDAQFSTASLSNGSHTLSVTYAGDQNFLPSTSSPVSVTVGGSAAADFALASSGAAAVTVPAGSAAVFSFTETPVNGSLSSPILLTAAGLPAGAVATFSPAYLPPGSAPQTFTLTIQTLKTAGLPWKGTLVFAGLLGFVLLPRRRKRLAFLFVLGAAVGCGDRVNTAGQDTAQSRTYNITVNATSTSNSGAALLHSSTVTLTLQ